MAGIICITVQGVLKQEIGEGPITQGIQIYHGLKHMLKIALITDESIERTQHWLKLNGLQEHAYLLPGLDSDGDDPVTRRTRQIGRLRANAEQADMLLDPDPEVVAEATRQGITGLLFAHPKYASPKFRPDYSYTPKPWDEIASEMTRQRLLRDNDPRKDADSL